MDSNPGQQPGAYGGQPPAGPYPGQYPQGHQAEGWPGSPGGYPRAQGGGPGGYAQPGIGQAGGHDRGFFPDIPRDSRPQAPMSGPKIPLAAALQVKGLGRGSASNPLIAAAASLLILLGRLRTGLVEMQAAPLMDHVTREIDAFERNALMAGVNPHEALVAKYALSGTADDIVQNLPGADRGNWLQYSMVARFFHKRDSGVGFFQEVEKAMQAPGQNYNLLELMLTCLNLGFEGQYRTMPNGAADLARIRASIYETLRRVHPRPDEDISPVWNPVELGKRRRWRAIPLPMLLGAGVFLVFAAFAGLSMWINRDGAAMASELRALGQGAPALSLSRTTYVPPPPPPTSTQLERIREALADEVGQGVIAVLPKGDYIAIRVGMLQLFDSGSVEIKPGFIPLAMRITEVLNSEGGPVLVQGHTDNVPLRGTGRFKSNDQLSLARAESVREVLSGAIDDPARISVEGRGEAEPVATNDTEDGRAHNRRVEILLAREGSWQRPDEVMIEGVRPAGAPDAATDTATEPTAQMNDTTEASQ
ncbi:MAG: type IVB secretion system protein IcmH/DotU [Paracoccus sp. (in: a-proteobacteria)]|nr:type IVB secretion system protein IcmH/DotU [Paracoccus sp. (in: a-proteobacteria)]